MKCQFCSNPANVHLTDIVGGKKKETHLCQRCAEEQKLVQKEELNLPAILQALIGHHAGPLTDELSKLVCPACGIRYMEFRNQRRLGCPHDYTVFRTGLEPLLQRIHRAGRHKGKVPRRRPVSPARQVELVELRRRLQDAVTAEAYEDAARLRDLLREKEAAE